MDDASSHPVSLFVRHWNPRRLAAGLCAAGLPWLVLGCAERSLAPTAPPPPLAALVVTPETVRGAAPETSPSPKSPEPAVTPLAPAAESKQLPVSLDAVLRLSEGQNTQIALARERLSQAGLEQELADSAWIPQINVGVAYGRHEGGIQNEDGTLTHSSFGNLFAGMEVNGKLDLKEATFQRINAERKVWQQRGDLSRVTNETLLDSANTYLDLLTARTGEAVTAGLTADLDKLREFTEKQTKVEPGAKVQMVAIQAAIQGQKQGLLRAHQQGDAASAKLAYLLGVDPCTGMVPVDRDLMPIHLVDANVPCCDLVSRALANGPGVHELQGLLATIQNGMAEAQSPRAYLPVFELGMREGAFGAGPGDDLGWDNRLDIGLQARWNLGDFLTAKQRLRIAQSGYQQASLTYQDLRGKLALGVAEAQSAIQSGRDQILACDEQVKRAREAYNLSDKRLRERVTGSSAGEVLQALFSLQQAQVSKLQAISAYNKAQVRLLLLTSPSNDSGAGCAH